MPRQSSGYRKGLAVAGVLAALALAARGIVDLRDGGWPLIGVAVAVLAAIALRQTIYRD